MSVTGLFRGNRQSGTQKLSELVDGKRVALVGNAQSLFGKNLGQKIDEHDIVIRLNRGFIVEASQQGSRTDISGTSRPLSVEQIATYDPKLVYWLFWRRWRIPTWNDSVWSKVEVVPIRVWRAANRRLEGRPTSGFVMLHTLLAETRCESVSVFGFDFYRTDNFYRGSVRSRVHNHASEEAAFFAICREYGDRVQLTA